MIRHLLCSLSLLMICFVATPLTANAFDIFGGADCGKASDSAVCDDKNSGDPLTGDDGLLIKIANIVALVAGVGAVAMLVYGGINFITSNGDSNNIASARSTIFNALIGVAVIVLARTLIVFVLDKI